MSPGPITLPNESRNQTAQQCCQCRDGGGCLYTVIQWRNSAGVRQMNKPGLEPARRKYGVYTRQRLPFFSVRTRHHTENVQVIIRVSFFSSKWFFFRRCSSRTMRNMEKILPQYQVRGIRWVAFLCPFESAARQSADDAFSSPSYFASQSGLRSRKEPFPLSMVWLASPSTSIGGGACIAHYTRSRDKCIGNSESHVPNVIGIHVRLHRCNALIT